MTDLTSPQLQQQYEGTRLAAAAYGAAPIKALLATIPSPEALATGVSKILAGQGFTAAQANSFVSIYTPVAALDQDGEGAVLFRVNGTDQIATAVRGTDKSTLDNAFNDITLADTAFALNHLPTYQTTLIANFVLSETRPAGQSVPQFAVQGINSNADDLSVALSNSTAAFGDITGQLQTPLNMPRIVQTGTVLGTGRALGTCVDAAGHSEGSPEVTVVGSAIAQCMRITTVNGPGVSLVQMQSVADQITQQAGLPRQNLALQNQLNSQLNLGTAGVSIIDGLNDGLPGTNITLGIPTSLGGVVGSHSSLVAMNTAEEALFRGDLTQRISLVGRVTVGNEMTGGAESTNFPNTQGSGRGSLNPDVVAPATTVYNSATALSNAPINSSGGSTPNYVVQPGDTVGGIAIKLGLTPFQYSEYLKSVYGPDADLNRIVAGRELPVPAYASHAGSAPGTSNAQLTATPSADNDYQPGASNGEAEAAAYIESQNSSTPANDSSAIYDQLVDAFNNAPTNNAQLAEGVQYADAGNNDVLSDAGGGDGSAEGDSAPNDPLALAEYAPAAPETIASASQAELAQQAALEEAQFNAAANNAASALSLVNSLANLQHFDKLTDLSKLQSLVGLYNQIDNLGQAGVVLSGTTAQVSGDTGGNLPGDLGQWGAGLSLITALQGNDPIAQASAAGAFYNSIGSASSNIPLPYLQALNLIGAIESGNTISMVSSAVAFIPGWGTAASIAISIIAPLLADKPPPPEGAIHYEWDANGNIQIKLDFNQSGGGAMAQSTAQSVQGLLNSIVQSINDQTADTSDKVAINPYLLPRVGYSQSGGAWIEMTTPDGGSYREVIQGNNLAQRLFDVLTENGGIAPVWQGQTQLGHMQQLLAQGAGQGEIAAQLGARAGGHAYHGNQAYALEGNATESADFMTQSFGALVVHLNTDAVQASVQALQGLQDQQAEHAEQTAVQTSTLYRDTEGDGYYEKTEWVSATDVNGNLQGLLVIDYNGNGQIETRDILNLGGSVESVCYLFDSFSSRFHGRQRQFLFKSANTSQWRIAA